MALKKAVILIQLMLSGLFPALIHAEVRPTIVYEYYDVPVDENKPLTNSVLDASPNMANGKKVVGQTVWQLGYKYTRFSPSLETCRLATLEVTCDCTIRLPRLVGANAALSRDFETYLLRLDEHERRHCGLATEYAGIMEAELKAMLGKDQDKRCDLLDAELKARYDRIYAECDAAQVRYDLETGHGKDEGVDLHKYDPYLKRGSD